MNLKNQRQLLASAGIVGVLLTVAPALAFTGEKLAGEAKVGIAQAREIALRKITDEELEREGGGSGLRYLFDIKSGAHTQEVGVDAQTGKVLENAREGANPD